MKPSANNYVKYTSLAFQMAAILLVFVLAGHFIDKKMALRIPIFTIVLSLIGIFAALYSSLKDFIKKS
ncbi:MAG: AtpZ/AtpI family protein [Bacteroidales bacterium]|nr:AtpZ/AtpI family protein [Bacteroidales bacterium]